jgi:hypothetical protein
MNRNKEATVTICKKKNPAFAEPGFPKSIHHLSANFYYFSTSLSLQQDFDDIELWELEDLLNKHSDRIGLTPDLEHLGKYTRDVLEHLRWIDQESQND